MESKNCKAQQGSTERGRKRQCRFRMRRKKQEGSRGGKGKTVYSVYGRNKEGERGLAVEGEEGKCEMVVRTKY